MNANKGYFLVSVDALDLSVDRDKKVEDSLLLFRVKVLP
jgi:hypothetical protein